MSLFHKGASKEFKEEFNHLGKNTKKYKIPISKEAKGIYKNEKKKTSKTKTKTYLTNYNLLTAQDLWQAHYQILLTILLMEFIKLNAEMNTIINVKHGDLNTKALSAFLNIQTLKVI